MVSDVILTCLVDNNNAVYVDSNPNAPVNGMHLCVKGRYGIDFVNHADRLTTPKVRQYLLENKTRNGSDRVPGLMFRGMKR